MKNKILSKRETKFLFTAIVVLIALAYASLTANAQNFSPADGEMATCKLMISGKSFTPNLNQNGYFNQITDVPIEAIVAIEVSYPDGKEGDKLVIEAEDGGKLDNGNIVKVAQLDNERKVSFIFHVSQEPGLFRICLHKGNDFKTIRLWAGPELPLATKQ